MKDAGETRTSLYRFYDDRRERLYIGISNDPWRRWREHVRTALWYPRARHWTVTWYDSEASARRAEARAIRGEFPLFNKAGAPDPVPVRFRIRAAPVARVCAVLLALQPILAAAAAVAHMRWLVILTVVSSLTIPVPLIIRTVVYLTPEIRRLACWLDRHVIQDEGTIWPSRDRG